MAERTTAAERLERVLYLLPALRREEKGIPVSDLARTLDTTESQILDDVNTVIAREFYHPAGGATDVQIGLRGDRLRVWTGGIFERPTRLGPKEAAALALALRARAAEREAEGDESTELALARRLEEALAVNEAEPVAESFLEGMVRGRGEGGYGDLLAFTRRMIATRRRCRIRYVKAREAEPDDRVICPYALAFAEGAWYVIGYCTAVEDMRRFRLDRIVEAVPAEGTFEPPEDFDPEDYLDNAGKRVFGSDEDVSVTVRYSEDIARWLAERELYEETGDGGILVRHRVADPAWLVRHVLQYGPDAEVVEPENMRELVVEAAGRLA